MGGQWERRHWGQVTGAPYLRFPLEYQRSETGRGTAGLGRGKGCQRLESSDLGSQRRSKSRKVAWVGGVAGKVMPRHP